MAKDIIQCANKVSVALDADVILFNTSIERGLDDHFLSLVSQRNRKKNVFLILVTPGGDADAAYRIARCLQDSYEQYIVFVPGYCKSAGTLCVLGANEIVMCEKGELGPLDVQLYKKDELGELSSGLVAVEALQVLQCKAFEMFEEYFLTIKRNGGGQITFKTATEIAMKMSMGLFESLYKQIDPIQLGESARSMKIATAYGQRLMVRSGNFSDDTLETLSETYPSHGFVIDRPEAESLFSKVRPPTEDEDRLRHLLGDIALNPQKTKHIKFLSDEFKGGDNGKTKESTGEPPAKKSK